MENTSQVLFEDDRPQWFVAVGDQSVGPLKASEVYERVLAGDFSFTHYVWKPDLKEWIRICDCETFQVALPKKPSAHQLNHLMAPPMPAVKKAERAKPTPPSMPSLPEEEVANWFLFYNKAQTGPYTMDEVCRALKTGKVNPRVHAWQDGMKNWSRIEEIAAFKETVKGMSGKSGGQVRQKESADDEATMTQATQTLTDFDMRHGPRKPIVARILLTNENTVITGMCRDISVGGMQVLTDKIPGPVGTKIKINVSPSDAAGMAPFVAEGEIIRHLEDGRGFSFRFKGLPKEALKAIENYTES